MTTNREPAPPATALAVVSLVALVALFHGPSLAFGFVYDDRWTLLDNPVVHTPGNLLHLLGASFARAGVPDAARPVTLATEMLDWAVAGPAPLVFHLQNLLWHAAVAALGFLTLRRHGVAPPVAWLAAAIFAVHPLVVEPVAVISYREDLLAAAFTLLALRLAAETGRLPLAAAAGATLLGVLAKENASLTPLLFAALVIVGAQDSPGRALRARAGTLAALAVPVLAGFAWRWWALGVPGVVSLTAEVPAQHHARSFVLPRAALGFVQGLAQFVWPRGLHPEYPDLPAASQVSALGWVALGVLVAVTGLALAARRRAPALALGWIWAVIAYLPHLGLVPLTNLRADRYFYLPALGLALLAAALLTAAAARLGATASSWPLRTWTWALALGLVVALGTRSLRQARIWRDDLSVFTAAAAADPQSQRALVGLAAARLRAGQSLAALEAADAALALGEAARPREMRGIVLLAQGAAPAAVGELERALGEASAAHRPQVLFNLGLACARAGDRPRARTHLEESLRLAPLHDKPALELAQLALADGDVSEARRLLEALLVRVPGSREARRLLDELPAPARTLPVR